MRTLNKNIEKCCPVCTRILPLDKFRLRKKTLARCHANVDSYCLECRTKYDKERHKKKRMGR